MTALRKLFVAALTLSVPLAALAQTAPAAEAKPAPPPPPAVQVYGTINVNLHYAEMSDAFAGDAADLPGRFVISADSSNVGVRGTLKLSDWASAVYQCETSANVEGEALAALCNRNSRIGLSGIWGTLAFGSWDTPMKSAHYGTKADDPFGNTDVFGHQALMGSPGFQQKTNTFNNGVIAANTGTVAGFDSRGAGSVLWWSPKIANMLTVRAQVGVDEFRSVGADQGQIDPMFLAAGANVDIGPISAFAAAEYREDFFGIRTMSAANAGNTAAKDLAWRVGAGTDLPLGVGNLNVLAWVEQLSYEQEDAGGTALTEYSRLAYLVGAKLRMGNHEFRARYTQALDPDITGAAGAPAAATNEDERAALNYTLGYAYHLAKSTQVYGFFTQIMNDDQARYTFGVAGSSQLTTGATGTPVGSDPMAAGVGIRHAF